MSQPAITLGLFLHSHQPVGNYDWVFEQNWERAYGPMLEALIRHPGIHATLHYSGPLIEWLTANRPEFDAMMKELVGRRQVELAGAGFYEPVLAMIPEADRQGQLRLMSRELKRRWGAQMHGAWLTERVWEPQLAASLARAGVQYTLVDDAHFAGAGISQDDLDGYYLTEDEGRSVGVFAGLRLMRASLPWKPVPSVISTFKQEAKRGPGRLLVMGDDGEKFGAWPQTYESCWGRGAWVEKFFTAVEKNSDWLRTTTLADWLASHEPKGTVYFPTASYHEMEEWALPPDQILAQRAFAGDLKAAAIEAPEPRPGFWRNFLVKYPESAAMRHRIFRVRALIDELPPGRARNEAERLLWKGENNCPYWHGIFGGVYLQNIRTITTANLASAETKAVEAAETMVPFVRVDDLDIDGRPELLLRTARQQVVIDPAEGGAIIEWDLARPSWPLTTVIARRREAYHDDLGSAGTPISPGVEGLALGGESPLVYDPARRVALQERFLPPRTTRALWQSGARDVADLRTRRWKFESPRRSTKSLRATLTTEATGVAISKSVALPAADAHLEVRYALRNNSPKAMSLIFLSEWNLNLPGVDGEVSSTLPEHPGDSPTGRLDDGGSVGLDYEWDGFEAAWLMPVETVSSSEAGLNLSYQGFCVAFIRHLSLQPGEEASLSLKWSAS